MSQNNMTGMGAWGVGWLLTAVLGARRTVMTSVSSWRLKGSENQGLCLCSWTLHCQIDSGLRTPQPSPKLEPVRKLVEFTASPVILCKSWGFDKKEWGPEHCSEDIWGHLETEMC